MNDNPISKEALEHIASCKQCRKTVDESIDSISFTLALCDKGRIFYIEWKFGKEKMKELVSMSTLAFGFAKHSKTCDQCCKDLKDHVAPSCELGRVYYEEFMTKGESVVEKFSVDPVKFNKLITML